MTAPAVSVRPFHGSYPGMPDLFHVYCSEHPDFGYCGERADADRVADEHRAKHGEAPTARAMTAPTVEQIAEVLRPHLSLDSIRAWTPEVRAAHDAASGRPYPEARAAALDVYARQVAEQVAALGVGDGEVEWGVRHSEAGWEGSDLDTWDVHGTPYDEATALSDAARRRGSHAVQRTVGPWVEVEGDEQP